MRLKVCEEDQHAKPSKKSRIIQVPQIEEPTLSRWPGLYQPETATLQQSVRRLKTT